MGGDGPGGGFQFVQNMAEKKIREVVTEMFDTHDIEEVRKSILAGSSLVESETPEKYREWLEENGSQYEHIIRSYAHPDKVWGWMTEPDWASSDETVEDLNELVDVIENTPGGKKWFVTQVYDLWEMAGVNPPDGARPSDDE